MRYLFLEILIFIGLIFGEFKAHNLKFINYPIMTSNLFHTKYGIFEDKFMTYTDYFLSKVALISTDDMF